MRSVIIGSNRFSDCQTLLSLKDQPLLQVLLSPLRLSLRLPRDLPSRIFFEIVDNEVREGNHSADSSLRIVPSETNVSVFWNDVLLVSATRLDSETTHVKLDLRRIGIRIYDDNEGLHIGKNVVVRNHFAACVTAISVG